MAGPTVKKLGRFATKFARKRKEQKKAVPITINTLSKSISKVGSGKNAWYTIDTKGNFSALAPSTPGRICLILSEPSSWQLDFNSAATTDVEEQPAVIAKSIRIRVNTRVAAANTPAMFMYFFVVSLKPTQVTTLGGGAFTTTNLVDGINYKLGDEGNILLNPDCFYVHKAWHTIMGATSNIHDANYSLKWSKLNWNLKLKNTISHWHNINEQELKGPERLYFIAFQVNCLNGVAAGYPLQLTATINVAW